MAQIITSLYDDHGRAREAVRALEQAGFPPSDMGLVASNAAGLTPSKAEADDEAPEAAATGATIGGLAGAGAGLLSALGVIAIPGLGPLVAAGTLATTLTTAAGGALAGGLVGSLIDYGMHPDDANEYAEGVERGGTVVTLRASDERAAEARSILESHGPVRGARQRAYSSDGLKTADAREER